MADPDARTAEAVLDRDPPSSRTEALDKLGSSTRQSWYGYAAFVLGILHALLSIYWVAGGTAGLDTVGGQIEELARARSPVLIAGVWVAAGLKVIAALLGPAVVQRSGQRVPWWMLLPAAWAATTILVTYGGVLVIVEAMVQIGLIQAPTDMNWKAFHWHLFVWDPWFLLWGLLLGAAAWRFTQQRRLP